MAARAERFARRPRRGGANLGLSGTLETFVTLLLRDDAPSEALFVVLTTDHVIPTGVHGTPGRQEITWTQGGRSTRVAASTTGHDPRQISEEILVGLDGATVELVVFTSPYDENAPPSASLRVRGRVAGGEFQMTHATALRLGRRPVRWGRVPSLPTTLFQPLAGRPFPPPDCELALSRAAAPPPSAATSAPAPAPD